MTSGLKLVEYITQTLLTRRFLMECLEPSEHRGCSPETGTAGYTQYLNADTLNTDLSGRYLLGFT